MNQIRVRKNKHANPVMKKLSEEDMSRLQAIDGAITNETPQARRQIGNNLEEEQGIQNEKLRRKAYNIHKYKEVPRETAQVGPEQIVKDTCLSHLNLEIWKFIIVIGQRTVDSRKKGEDFIFNSDKNIKLQALITQKKENDIKIIMEEPLMRYNSCTSEKYKKKEIIRIKNVLFQNVSISNNDKVLWNSKEKLYRVNKDFVKLSDKLESDIGPDDF
ncbi:MAG: hypothetical protein EZS28_005661 [Streblomastix strix]|uniref:Uncharacterized protein n=1 Tax=Streblomastix strix TaxID=222440 RepID=A0A5J4WWB6_9EUKA|nr:MAG: hypothetical protein EZS28_005661 [Streblomastix strix]